MIEPGRNDQHTNYAAVTSASGGTSVQGGAANTKGSWTLLFNPGVSPGRVFDAAHIIFTSGSSGTNYLVDFAHSSDASTFTPFINNLMMTSRAASAGNTYYLLPVRHEAVTSGSGGFYARCQNTSASATLRVSMLPMWAGIPAGDGGGSSGGLCFTYGGDTANSRGTTIDAGAVAHTKGAWTVLSASTTAEMTSLVVAVGPVADRARTGLPITHAIDIGVGTAGNEHTIVSNIITQCNTSLDFNACRSNQPFPVSVPAGSRLVARCQCTHTATGDRTLDVIVYGFTGNT